MKNDRDERDKETLKIAIAGWTISYALFGSSFFVNEEKIITLFFMGCIISYSTFFWREVNTLHSSLEGKMKAQAGYQLKTFRLYKSTFFKIILITPMLFWIYRLNLPLEWLLILEGMVMFAAIYFARVEHYYLWT